MQLDYAGPEGVLEQDEYEEFRKHALTAMDEGGLGWTTTAGADVGFYKTDVTTRQIAARNQAKDMKADLEGDAAGQYAILQGVFTATEDYDADDMMDALTYVDAAGNEIEPSEEVIGAIQRLVGQSLTYDNFMDNLAAYERGAGGDYIRAELITNPQINLVYNDLQKNYKAINVLDNKLAGINDTPIETNLNIFVDEISDVTNEKVLFGLYDEAIKGQDIDFENDPFFDAVEAQLGVIDASDAYLKHKGLSTEVVPLSEDAQQLTTEIAKLNKEITALSQFYGATSDEVTERKMELLRFEIQLNKITQAERVEKSQAEMDTTITELSSLTGLSEEEIAKQVEEIRAAGVPWEGVRTEILGGWIPGKMKTTRLGGGQGRMY
jgi:predicted  nucleic acid-binding Zn-ribbon protein